ncbi:MAG: response regulator [Deltaproteobacteria bacterium]|nr:response regulator [Deltaproteobacteria bacterium]
MKKILKNRILIVNDDPVQLRILAKHLEKSGKEAITCAEGEEALRKLREIESVDMIITDLYMPGIDGWKLCRLLRSIEFSDFNKIPILVMSATFSGSDAEEITRELGANGFISVPYNPEILRSTIENILLGKVEQRELRVLVVEDSESLRGTICEGLREYGYSVFEASNGNQAYSLFEEVNPEVVILDYHLPEHDGAELLTAFKLPQSQAAVLVTTGDANPELAMKVTKMGADAFVRKPFKIGYLIDLCEKIRREWSLLRVEKLLEDRTLELRRILETSVDGIVITDTSGCIVQINSAVEKMLEYSKDEIVGKNIWELMPLDDKDHEKAVRIIKKLKIKERMTGVEQVWKRKDGNLFHVELNLSILKDAEGNTTGAMASIRDITDRKRAGEEIKDSEERYHSLIENAIDAIISVNEEGVIVTFNKKAEEMYGYDREEILGKSVLLLVPPQYREKQKEAMEKFKEVKASKVIGRTVETKGFRKDGREFPVETSVFGLEINGEHVFTSFVRDITSRKEMEDKLLQSEKLRSLGELAGGVAHNFNNTLAVILGRTQLLGRSFETLIGKQERRKSIDDLKKSLAIIEKAAFDGVDTVRRIQEFSRKRGDDKNFTGVDLNEVIEHTLEFTKVRWKDEAGAKGIKINIQKELSLIFPIEGSGSELREVFINIMNNALDAMPKGGQISIKTFVENSHVVVLVKDSGIGIPKDIKDKIFDPFFTTKGVQSTGLGMSASYGIINRHRGTITVDSVEGQGTTFSIKFPRPEKVIKEKKKPIANEQNGTSILVVEDEEGVRTILKDILEDGGYKVEVAPNGKKGIKLFQEKKFNLVFTDLGMPGMSGWQVAEEIKKMNGKTKVALVTGWEVDLNNNELKKCGVDLVINKPFQMNQILGSVKEMMEDGAPIA